MAASVILAWTVAEEIPNQIIIEATRPMSPGVLVAPAKEFRYTWQFSGEETSPYVLSTAYFNKFGAIQAGQKIFFRVSTIDPNGLRSTGLVASAIVT